MWARRRSNRRSRRPSRWGRTWKRASTGSIPSWARRLADKDAAEPEGHETDLGGAMIEAEKRVAQTNKRMARAVIFSDFASNYGINPLVAAAAISRSPDSGRDGRAWAENVGKGSRDIAIRDIVAPPSGFVKNRLEVKGTILARGFTGQPIEVKMFVEGQAEPVAKTTVTVPEGSEVAPITNLYYIPQTSGEKMITLEVEHHEGEFVTTNNKQSSFVTVLSGGLNVMFLQGPNFTWDYRYLMRSIMTAQDIQVDGVVIRRPAQGESSEVDDTEFAPGRYNIYILSDLPADFLAPHQHKLLVQAVNKGAGLMMLGGRSSFGAGGWAQTELADILPAEIHPADGQVEPEGGIKFVPTSPKGLTSYILQIGATDSETAKLWDMMPPILGTNRFGEPKKSAEILAQSGGANPEPLMLSMEVKGGRVLAYGGDTWVWARASEEGRIAHRKFWRQVIFWLSHKENQGDESGQAETGAAADQHRSEDRDDGHGP